MAKNGTMNHQNIIWVEKEKNENILTILGGPEFPSGTGAHKFSKTVKKNCLDYLKEKPSIDYYSYADGETGFTSCVKDYLKSNLNVIQMKNNNIIPDIVSELENINEVFLASNDNKENYTESTNIENDKGVMVFGGGSPSSLSEEQFNQLKSIVMDLRTSIIEGN